MADLAPPVWSADRVFFFSSVLHVDIGDGNAHPRASTSELTKLLRPQIPGKKPKAPITPIKDQVGHWYTAQLVHYGLPRTTVKNTAKVRLLDALNQNKLAVPPEILELEKDLKKQWQAANRKVRKGSAAGAVNATRVTTPNNMNNITGTSD
jgi:hypothetical protein